VNVAPQVIAAAPDRLQRLVADRGYDADIEARLLKPGELRAAPSVNPPFKGRSNRILLNLANLSWATRTASADHVGRGRFWP